MILAEEFVGSAASTEDQMRKWKGLWISFLATFLACGTSDSVEKTRSYKIGQGFPFPPWDVGPMEGVGSDVLRAICDANGPMRCEIVVLPAQECFDTDQDGNAVVGSALASGRVDGCMTWFDTPERRQLG